MEENLELGYSWMLAKVCMVIYYEWKFSAFKKMPILYIFYNVDTFPYN